MKLTTEAHIAAPLELVWHAFNEPTHIMKWDATPGWYTMEVTNDLVVGGMLRLRINHRYDDSGSNFAATYTQIEPMSMIEWQTDNGIYAQIEFKAYKGGVTVRQIFDPELSPSEEEQQADWQGVLNNFAQYVTALQRVSGKDDK